MSLEIKTRGYLVQDGDGVDRVACPPFRIFRGDGRCSSLEREFQDRTSIRLPSPLFYVATPWSQPSKELTPIMHG